MAARGPRHGMYKHGLSRHPLFATWNTILFRCENPRCGSYEYYGGSGIRVCGRWHDVALFIADIEATIGPRPEGQYPSGRPVCTLDRIDTEGHYSCGCCEECARNGWPANCRWATKAEQTANQRKRRDNTSGYVGVYRRPGRWVALLGINGKRKNLGYFADPLEAARAYNAAALEAFGEYARLNPIPGEADPAA